MIAFMLFHTVSKKGPKALAYTLARRRLDRHGILVHGRRVLVAVADPGQRILARGMARAVVRIHGRLRRFAVGAALQYPLLRGDPRTAHMRPAGPRRPASLLVPAAVSLGIWWSWQQPAEGTAEVSVVQPNVDCYDKFNGRAEWQERQHRRPADGSARRGAVHPAARDCRAGALLGTGTHRNSGPADEPGIVLAGAGRHAPQPVASRGRCSSPGANTNCAIMPAGLQPRTARRERLTAKATTTYFNTAVGLDSAGRTQLHHKGKLVIGVENTPTLHLRHPAIPRHRPGRRRGADRHGPARHGLRTRGA